MAAMITVIKIDSAAPPGGLRHCVNASAVLDPG